MGFSRQEDWSGLPFPPPGDLPDPGVKPRWTSYHLSLQGSPKACSTHYFQGVSPPSTNRAQAGSAPNQMRPGVFRVGWPDEIKGDIKGREEGLLLGSFQERAEMQWSAPSTFREDECVNPWAR
ncbi:unnamed protein product [Rangifer tarandus platyrhynchus]|uniref:Uncharacterized protein n=2 Tax=Rangifer tarandus platyrhynchus TaxID=3082113 RepID=A0AC59ZAY1_RANTA|nr:unnamed protein product [Rangifer tarandus platyrhynchus]